MRFKRTAICLFLAAIFATGYLYWARDRVYTTVQPDIRRYWPYPDPWLFAWYRHLDTTHPAAPGEFKIEGELPRLQLHLDGLVGISTVATLFCFAWLWSSRKLQP